LVHVCVVAFEQYLVFSQFSLLSTIIHQQMQNFLSCDWGTSFFRLRYVQAPGLKFESVERAEGIAATFEAWKTKKEKEKESERFLFFRNVIVKHIRFLEKKVKTSLDAVPLVISGMASSSIGMLEIPYKECPFKADGSDLRVVNIKATKDFNHETFIISGIKTKDDVLRGEETQLIGCNQGKVNDGLYIFPGTHSKHVLVKKGIAVSFKTYMTGEFFELLSQKSILSASIRNNGKLSGKENKLAFAEGVK